MVDRVDMRRRRRRGEDMEVGMRRRRIEVEEVVVGGTIGMMAVMGLVGSSRAEMVAVLGTEGEGEEAAVEGPDMVDIEVEGKCREIWASMWHVWHLMAWAALLTGECMSKCKMCMGW